MRNLNKFIGAVFLPILVVFFTFVYNEYLIYWQTLMKCNWPKLNESNESNLLKVMLISDTHLLGSRNGHWFDKLRREWQQHQSYQTARALLQPDYIIILGDLTDEGKWCSDQEWKYYERRTQELFYPNNFNSKVNKTKLLIVVGNHDVGFHYDMNERKLERFKRSFNIPFVKLDQPTQRNDLNFIVVNSMAMENDRCRFCSEAQRQLKKINKTLDCLKLKNEKSSNLEKKCKLEMQDENFNNRTYSRPIIFTHFPLYRQSNLICPNDIDSESTYLFGSKAPIFKENFDCLSKDSTKQLLELTNARLVFNGHTHYSCFNTLHGIPEYTVASFSWRNIKTPSMLLLHLDDQNHFISKCFLPSETNVFTIYIISSIFLIVYFAFMALNNFKKIFLSKIFNTQIKQNKFN